ncbi:MAG: TlyA family RNA methyltransferase [Pseudomonadota bacterium]
MRLDRALVARGLAESRTRAQALIAAGAVRVAGHPATRPAQMVAEEVELTLAGDPMPWVSRGALKLLHALEQFDLSPEGMEALDLGASTGGFVEVLLARGAARVHALDVGRGQLHPRIAADPRVVRWEGVNARDLPADLPAPEWVTADLSFISLTLALPPALDRAALGATLVALVKPQFEVGREAVGRGGVVRDAEAQAAACVRVRARVAEAGWAVLGEVESPITGGDGNREFLLAARKEGSAKG